MSNSFEKLRDLPDCFTDKTFLRKTGFLPQSAQVALSRMKAAGLIESAGNRSGIYYNLFKNKNAKDEQMVNALLFEYPSAVLCGESVLHNAGWITQIPSAISVCVLKRLSYQKIDGFSIFGRDVDWFKNNHEKFLSTETAEFSTFGLKSVTPEFALADLLHNGAGIDMDDVYIPDEKIDAFNAELEQLQDGKYRKKIRHRG